MNYDEMSDFEINKAVAEALGHKLCEVILPNPARTHAAVMPTETLGQRNFDYCNNPSDGFPIITENNIGMWRGCLGLNLLADHWCSRGVEADDSPVKDKNPLRAAMIVYLKMMEKEECAL